MANLISPPAIIFCNNDLTENVKSALERQLFISETIDGYEFDARLIVSPTYVQDIHKNQLRLLVIRSYLELDNRDKADIVLFIKSGIASVLKNNFGPPGKSYAVDRMYLSQLFYTSK